MKADKRGKAKRKSVGRKPGKGTDKAKRKRDESRGRVRRIHPSKDLRCVSIELFQYGEFRGVFSSVREAANVFGLDEKRLSACLRKRQKETGEGFTVNYFSKAAYGAKPRGTE